ncbi:MAG: hypothetical protein H8D47_01785, partial [Planctomycetes bacterium]|nr:hypothetical protein [Planctomycetota bacterium]
EQEFALYGDGEKITNFDIMSARQELDMLRKLGADTFLNSISVSLTSAPNLHTIFMGQLLFGEKQRSSQIIPMIKQIVVQNKYRITSDDIHSIFTSDQMPAVLWILLNAEAQKAGIKSNPQNAYNTLSSSQYSQLMQNRTYTQFISPIVDSGIPEESVWNSFAKLIAINDYADSICSNGAITISQLQNLIKIQGEQANIELVNIKAAYFVDAQKEPSEQEITDYFNKYKNNFEMTITEQNPFGFGYKLADSAKLDYLAVKIEDVEKIVNKPTPEEVEQFYQRNRDIFVEKIQTDPNDPNSPVEERTMEFAEVATYIKNTLYEKKKTNKALKIVREAIDLTQTSLEDKDIRDLSSEDFAALLTDFSTTAEKLSNEYGIKVYSGTTGMMAAADMYEDTYMSGMYVGENNYNIASLTDLVFAIDEFGAPQLSPGIERPKMHQNIGPVKDRSNRFVAAVRVKNAKMATVPQRIDAVEDKTSLELGEDVKDTSKSLRERIINNIKIVAAMETAKDYAQKLADTAEPNNWDSALEVLNADYAKDISKDPNKPGYLKLTPITGLKISSELDIQTLALQSKGNPVAEPMIRQIKIEKMRFDKFFSLISPDANSLENTPYILEFEPDGSYYVIKDLTIERFNQKQYEMSKATMSYVQEVVSSQSASAVFFNPENIIKRNRYQLIEHEIAAVDANEPNEPARESK